MLSFELDKATTTSDLEETQRKLRSRAAKWPKGSLFAYQRSADSESIVGLADPTQCLGREQHRGFASVHLTTNGVNRCVLGLSFIILET